MTLYRIYIDETGNHDMGHADDPNQRFLGLTGVILEKEYREKTLKPEMDALKREFFGEEGKSPVIFHRKEMVNKRPPFEALRDEETHQAFDKALLLRLREWEYHLITVVIDKKAHRDKYTIWHYHPYHYCLEVLTERFVLFLKEKNAQGDVLVESRGMQEDKKLKKSYRRLYEQGTNFIGAALFQNYLTSGKLKVKPKTADIAGLQLADLIAHPARRKLLQENQLIDDNRNVFGDRICEILYQEKYLRSRTGRIIGYGTKLLP